MKRCTHPVFHPADADHVAGYVICTCITKDGAAIRAVTAPHAPDWIGSIVCSLKPVREHGRSDDAEFVCPACAHPYITKFGNTPSA